MLRRWPCLGQVRVPPPRAFAATPPLQALEARVVALCVALRVCVCVASRDGGGTVGRHRANVDASRLSALVCLPPRSHEFVYMSPPRPPPLPPSRRHGTPQRATPPAHCPAPFLFFFVCFDTPLCGPRSSAFETAHALFLLPLLLLLAPPTPLLEVQRKATCSCHPAPGAPASHAPFRPPSLRALRVSRPPPRTIVRACVCAALCFTFRQLLRQNFTVECKE